MNKNYPTPWHVAFYHPSAHFQAIKEHVCIAAQNDGVIAICGPDDTESQKYARQFAATPEMLELVKACALGNTDPDDLQRMAVAILKRL